MTRSPRRKVTAVLAIAALGGGVLVLGAPVQAAPVAQSFAYNGTDGSDGSPQPLVVPAGICRIEVDAYGAAGADDTQVAALQGGG
ncbi:MAG TPA: hypothetical protein VGD99_05960, partial [Anaerolineae bacterium]